MANVNAWNYGMVPTSNGGWMLPANWGLPAVKIVFVDGHCVPADHEGLYRRILENHGHLVCVPVLSSDMSCIQIHMRVVKNILDIIAEIESVREIEGVRDTELSHRRRMDVWFGMLMSLSVSDFSKRWVGWLKTQLEELDRALRRLELVAEFRMEDPELADRMMEVLIARDAKARDKEKEIQTATAMAALVLD